MAGYPPFTMDPELARETREQLLRDGCAHPAISGTCPGLHRHRRLLPLPLLLLSLLLPLLLRALRFVGP